MTQTSVEWLEEKAKEFAIDLDLLNYFQQAKEIEKQQKIDFANNYGFDICGYDYDNAEQYYNETFKK